MEEEPTLPSFPRISRPSTFTSNSRRKRVRVNNSSPVPSSDPPVFSSDDDPSVDKYTQARRKQHFRGPWFDQQPASDPVAPDAEDLPKHKRKFERQYDSGVWMGSDGTNMSDPLDEQESVVPQSLKVHSDSRAQAIIEKCLEAGNETVDLSCQQLDVLENGTVRPLSALTKTIQWFPDTLIPSLRIVLSANYLQRLPRDLFNLERLCFLSLRNNELSELPQGIRNLRNLAELNVSQNALRYLPWEILALFRENGGSLEELQLHPNPYYLPEEPQAQALPSIGMATPSSDLEAIVLNQGFKLGYKCRTKVRFMDPQGRMIKGPNFPSEGAEVSARPHHLPVAPEDDRPEAPVVRGEIISHAHSLFELSLKACSQEDPAGLVAQNPSCLPEHITRSLLVAEHKNFSGPTRCTICEREVIIPRTEWIEWWNIVKLAKGPVASRASSQPIAENERDEAEKTVPLMRRGCSWNCVPKYLRSVADIEPTI